MSLAKVPAIFLIGLAFNVSLSPPTPATAKKDRVMGDGPVDMHCAMYLVKASYWIHAIIELAIIMAGIEQASPISKQVFKILLPGVSNPQSKIFLTPISALGTALLVLGAAIRWLSYREMGRHFTFHVSILKNHQLVKTGPYSVVRHPGYTGGVFSFLGMVLWYAAQGSWMRESGIWSVKLAWPVLIPVFSILCIPFLSMWRRMPKEDAILRDEFGADWDQWASSVRYRIIPYVY